MDDLSGLLVEGFGLRPRDRSAPMAASKAMASARSSATAPMPPPPSNPRTSWSTSPPGGLGGLDGIFGGTSGPRRSSPPAAVLDDDLFGVGRAPKTVDDDIFGSFSFASDDLLGGFGGKNAGGDLLVDFGGIGMESDVKLHGDDLLGGFGRGSDVKGKKLDGDQYATAASDDLLGGFGGIGIGSDAKGMRSDGGNYATGADEDLLGGFGVSGRGLDAKGKKLDVDAYVTNASDDLLGGFGGIEISSDAKGRKSDGGNYATRASRDLLGDFATSERGSGAEGNELNGDGYAIATSEDILGSFGGIGRGSNVKGKKLDGDSYATAASEDLLGSFSGIGRGSIVNEKKLDGDSYATVASEDLLGSFGGIGTGSDVNEKKLDRDSYATAASGDLLGGFGGIGREANLKGEKLDGHLAGNGAGGLDELLPGFGGASPPRVHPKFENNKSSVFEKSTTSIPKDPFINLDSTVPAAHSPGSFINTFEEFDIFSDDMKSEKTSRSAFDDGSFFDEFQGSVPLSTSDIKTNSKPYIAEGNTSTNCPTDLDGLNGSSADINFMFAETLKKHDPLDDLVTKPLRPADENRVHAQPMKSDQHERNSVKHVESADNIWFSVSESTVSSQSSASSSNIRKASSSPNILDDWNSLFAAPSSGEFQEIEGEPEERRRARLERHRRTLQRAAKALTEKNERDIQTERENAERHRIAETLDADIKRWAAGKEGNLRALLSSLQHVLWPECGWQPVTLTDLITSTSVKKVYRKATLCIHPDKVQQKGANVQQKYTAEKVFDILKEAWKKFNTEELS